MFCTELAEHKEAIICDFSRFYNVRAVKAGQSFTMEEALAYLKGLSMNTGSMYFAEKAGWKYAMSLEAQIQADTYDLHLAINSDPKKPNNYRYPRPYELEVEGVKKVAGSKVSMQDAAALYAVPVQTMTDEEILEHNRQVLAKNKESSNQ